ncbi:MAG: hypothetical protein K1X29_05770 [Bdellovibrionales bacterium]|nr:hypothetical protein [Bdellovibrionales bacterium]
MKILILVFVISISTITARSESNGAITISTATSSERIKATELDPKKLPFGKLIIVANQSFVYTGEASIRLNEQLAPEVGLEITDYSNHPLKISKEDYSYCPKENTIYFNSNLNFENGTRVEPRRVLLISYRDQDSTKQLIQNDVPHLLQVLDHPKVQNIISLGLENTFHCERFDSTTLKVFAYGSLASIQLEENLIQTAINIVCKNMKKFLRVLPPR